jgi:hypothetical protein
MPFLCIRRFLAPRMSCGLLSYSQSSTLLQQPQDTGGDPLGTLVVQQIGKIVRPQALHWI